jgi:GTP pyrophosphokinase
MAALVARHIRGLVENEPASTAPVVTRSGEILPNNLDPIVISGSEGAAVQLAPCCMPIPGDRIVGHLRRDQGMTVHTTECEVAKRQRSKDADRWIAVEWDTELNRRFDCQLQILVHNDKGVLARVAAEIGESDANITYVNMDDDKDKSMMQLRFTVQVDDRIHLARLIRNVRRIPSVARVVRERS